jgi:hypothetical protein
MRLSPTTQIERKQLIRGQACYKAQKRTGSALITAIKSEGYKVFRGERTVMRSRCLICNALVLATAITVLDIGRASADHDEAGPWVALFDGKTLGDWKPNENKDAFSVEDGCIVINGPRAHLFYMGKENKFKNFHFRAEVKTNSNSNSGIYFHTKWLDEGWPQHGYESQVNVSHRDPVKSGSLYNTVKIMADDIEKVGLRNDSGWVHEIIVRGKNVIVKLNGNVVIDYTEPEDKGSTVKLDEGTFALQAHDPGSTVYFRNIEVRRLPGIK